MIKSPVQAPIYQMPIWSRMTTSFLKDQIQCTHQAHRKAALGSNLVDRGDPCQSYVRATSRQLFASPQLTTLGPLGKYNPYSNAVRNFPRSVREQELTRTPTTTTAAETDYKVTPIITTATTHPFSCYWAGIYLVQWTKVKIRKCMEIPKKLISFLKLIKSLI